MGFSGKAKHYYIFIQNRDANNSLTTSRQELEQKRSLKEMLHHFNSQSHPFKHSLKASPTIPAWMAYLNSHSPMSCIPGSHTPPSTVWIYSLVGSWSSQLVCETPTLEITLPLSSASLTAPRTGCWYGVHWAWPARGSPGLGLEDLETMPTVTTD